jgi:hypothetical protein
VVAVYGFTELCCSAEVAFPCRSNLPALWHIPDRRTLHNRKRLTRIKAELRIQRKRAIVKRRLDKSYSREGALIGTIDDSLHQHTAHGPILHVRRNADGSNPGDGRTLVQTIAPDNLAIDLCHHAVESRMSEKHSEEPDSDLSGRDIRGKPVLFVDRCKRFVTDAATKTRVLW